MKLVEAVAILSIIYMLLYTSFQLVDNMGQAIPVYIIVFVYVLVTVGTFSSYYLSKRIERKKKEEK